jgi:hypothetical protein
MADPVTKERPPGTKGWAANETHLPPREFPRACPYDWQDILERPFEFDSINSER